MTEKLDEDLDLGRSLGAPDVPRVELDLVAGGEQRVGAPRRERGAVGEEPVVGRIGGGNIM